MQIYVLNNVISIYTTDFNSKKLHFAHQLVLISFTGRIKQLVS
jgi:hypothetical protein